MCNAQSELQQSYVIRENLLEGLLHHAERYLLAIARKIDALDQWCLRMLLGIRWYQFVRNDDVRRLTKHPNSLL